jgi:hypothetical protein
MFSLISIVATPALLCVVCLGLVTCARSNEWERKIANQARYGSDCRGPVCAAAMLFSRCLTPRGTDAPNHLVSGSDEG